MYGTEILEVLVPASACGIKSPSDTYWTTERRGLYGDQFLVGSVREPDPQIFVELGLDVWVGVVEHARHVRVSTGWITTTTVSYTHLTLPTIYSV